MRAWIKECLKKKKKKNKRFLSGYLEKKNTHNQNHNTHFSHYSIIPLSHYPIFPFSHYGWRPPPPTPSGRGGPSPFKGRALSHLREGPLPFAHKWGGGGVGCIIAESQ